MTDDNIRSEAEIADLAPYVPQSAIDAVRDAFRKIVLENQDHSALLDKLLPELQQMPSKRSQALDWLDVELARLSDDRAIALIDRLKRARSDGRQFERETRSVARPRNWRRLLPMVAAVGAMFMVLTYAWASAAVSLRAEERENAALQARVAEDRAVVLARAKRLGAARVEMDKLFEAQKLMLEAHRVITVGGMSDEQAALETLERVTNVSDEIRRSIEDALEEESPAGQEQP